MKRDKFEIARIYVPVKGRSTLKADIVQQIAQSMLESGQETPILVRRDGDRLVLVHGLHRLEARKALGEETIFGYVVQAQKH
jgi:sulfiredoxin